MQVTDVSPSGKFAVTSKSPEPPVPGGSHVAVIGVGEDGFEKSYAVTWYVTLAPAALVASAVTSSALIGGGSAAVVETKIEPASRERRSPARKVRPTLRPMRQEQHESRQEQEGEAEDGHVQAPLCDEVGRNRTL